MSTDETHRASDHLLGNRIASDLVNEEQSNTVGGSRSTSRASRTLEFGGGDHADLRVGLGEPVTHGDAERVDLAERRILVNRKDERGGIDLGVVVAIEGGHAIRDDREDFRHNRIERRRTSDGRPVLNSRGVNRIGVRIIQKTIDLLSTIVVAEPADVVEKNLERLCHSLTLEGVGIETHLRGTRLFQLADGHAHLEAHIVARLEVDIPVGKRSLGEVTIESGLTHALQNRGDNLLGLPSSDNRATDNLVERTTASQNLDGIREPELRELDWSDHGRRCLSRRVCIHGRTIFGVLGDGLIHRNAKCDQILHCAFRMLLEEGIHGEGLHLIW